MCSQRQKHLPPAGKGVRVAYHRTDSKCLWPQLQLLPHPFSNSLTETSRFTMNSAVFSAAVHPNSSILVWGGEDNYIHVCNASTGAETGALLTLVGNRGSYC